jgi:acetate kinase
MKNATAISHGNSRVEKFTGTIANPIGGYLSELGGLDMLVFTGGIGENDVVTRAEVCARLGTLGVKLDASRNGVQGAAVISADHSQVMVRVIAHAEDLMIVNHVVRLLGERPAD